MKLGFIGFGNMGEALWKGVAASDITPECVRVTEMHPDRLALAKSEYQLLPSSLEETLEASDYVFLCVKPQQAAEILGQIKQFGPSQVLISIMAGTTLAKLATQMSGKPALARVMPNTPALVGEGISAVSFNEFVTAQQRHLILNILGSIGHVIEVEESQLDAVTGISGSGPAFLYRIADAMAEAGVRNGLPYEDALRLASQTLVGAGKMLQEAGESPSQLVKNVSSPNGTTVAGLAVLDELELCEKVKAVIQAAIDRSKILSKE